MARRRHSAALLLAAAALAACRVLSMEEQLLARFFEAGRAYDRAALARVATIEWNPAREGTVARFVVVEARTVSTSRRDVVLDADVLLPDGTRRTTRFECVVERLPEGWKITRLRASRTSPAASSGRPTRTAPPA